MDALRILVTVGTMLVLVACGGGGKGGNAGSDSPAPSLESGPGDVANYFPDAPGDTWHYNEWTADGAGGRSVVLTTLSITGARTVLGEQAVVQNHRVVAGPVASGVPTVMDAYYAERPGGVVFLGTDDASDALGAAMVPYPVLLFPVTTGPIATVERTGVDFGADLDGDGVHESVAVVQRSSVAGFESVAVPAGRFADTARIVTDMAVTLTMSRNGSTRAVTSSETSWIAPNAGLIKQLSRIDGAPATVWAGREVRGLTVRGRRAGLSEPFVALLQAGPLNRTETAVPPDVSDRPVVASSGAGYLVVSRLHETSAPGIHTLRRIATAVGPDAGLPMRPVTAPVQVAAVPVADTLERNAMAFGGGIHLLVSEQRNAGPSGSVLPSIVAQRLNLDGSPIDPAPIQLVPPSEPPAATGIVSRHLGVAFGQDRFLVIHHGGPPQGFTSTTHVEGRFVFPDGSQGVPFRITPDFTHGALAPVVGFDGANFVVAWNRGGSNGWRLNRVTTSGTVLESPVLVASAPSVPLALAASDAGVLLAWIEDARVRALRFGRDLSPQDAASIDVSGPPSPMDRNGVQVVRFGGDHLVAWSESISTSMTGASQWVVRMQRIGLDGTVKNAPPPSPDPIAASMKTGFLASSVPDTPCCGYISGFVLPALATGGNDSALLVYAEGTSNGATPAERTARVRGVWIRPFVE